MTDEPLSELDSPMSDAGAEADTPAIMEQPVGEATLVPLELAAAHLAPVAPPELALVDPGVETETAANPSAAEARAARSRAAKRRAAKPAAVDLSAMDLSAVEQPALEQPAVDLSALELPDVEPAAGDVAPSAGRHRRPAKLEPEWRVLHRIRSGVVLAIASVFLGAVLAAAIGFAVTAAVVAVNHATHSSSTAP